MVEDNEHDRAGTLLAEVSNEMVKLYKEYFGRGPTKARTDWAGPDILICTLEDTLAPVERKLVELGQHERLRDTRTFFQYATMQSFVHPVERLTGRTVRAFVSGIDTRVEGLSTETFVFYAEGTSGPSRSEQPEG